MAREKATICVDGMTCSSCEARIEKALCALRGVQGAEASLKGGKVEVVFEERAVTVDALKAAIEGAGYTVLKKKGASTRIALGIGILLAAGYMIASSAGVFNALPKVDASLGYGMLFVVGLLTSVHCVAMCGGIALSQSVSKVEGHPAPGRRMGGNLEKLVPGLLYNGGRVLSYTLVGGIVGAFGSVFSFSPTAKGVIAGAAGLFMILLGLKMLGILSGLPHFSRLVPASVRNAAGRFSSGLRSKGPFAVGLLNGLMPCGPLQTMQLYALGTGSLVAGALAMFIFSVGTVPLMLVFSIAAVFLPRKFMPVMVKAGAVLVMFLGVITFGRAAALAGIALPELPSLGSGIAAASSGIPGVAASSRPAGGGAGILKASVESGVQTVVTDFGPNGYVPFAVQAGVPLRWIIRVKEEDLNGCNNPIVVPGYGIQKELKPGDNLIEFTPKSEGTIAYSCWMGMIRSRISVVSDIAKADSLPKDQGDELSGLLGNGNGGGAGGCCAGGGSPAFAGGKVPVDKIGLPVINNGIQEITITVNAKGYFPAAIVLQKGMKAKIKFKADQVNSCNNPVVFPEYNGALDLSRGQLETPPIPIVQDFTFQCGMGMIHGYVKVVDDLSKVNVEQVKLEIGKYRAKGGGGCCGG